MKLANSNKNNVCNAAIVMLILGLLASPLAAKDKPPAISADGLHLIPDTKMALVYVDPEADFSGYSKIVLLDAGVAFKKNWKREQRRQSVNVRISDSDMEDIKQAVAKVFQEAVVEVFDEQEGWGVVDASGPDVLVLRPAVINLNVSAPDIPTAGRSRSFTTTAGSATLYLELYDSVTGDKLAWLMDGISADTRAGFLSMSNSVTNTQEAKRSMKRWATQLRDGLDEVKANGLPD